MLRIHTINNDDIARCGFKTLYRTPAEQPVKVPFSTEFVIPNTQEVPLPEADVVLVKLPISFTVRFPNDHVLAVEKLVRVAEFYNIADKLVVFDAWSEAEVLPLTVPQDSNYMRARLADVGFSLSQQQAQVLFEREAERLYAIRNKFRIVKRRFSSHELRELGDRAIIVPDMNPDEDLGTEGEPQFEVDIAVGRGPGARHEAAVRAIRAWHRKCEQFAPERDVLSSTDQTEASVKALKEHAKWRMGQRFVADVKDTTSATDMARARTVLVVEESAGTAPPSLYRAMSSGRAVVWLGREHPALPSWIDTTGWLLRVRDSDCRNLGLLVRTWLREPGNDERIVEAGKKAREQWKLVRDWRSRLPEMLAPRTK